MSEDLKWSNTKDHRPLSVLINTMNEIKKQAKLNITQFRYYIIC